MFMNMKKNLWYFILLFTLCITIKNVNAQTASVYNVTSPTVIPPSPDAQSFMRYGEIPVDYSTGVPNIEIPLYEIKTGQLSLPISLSYHASGIRVSDVSSVVGLGWKLNAGGLLTRTIKGLPDESSSGVLNHGFLTQTDINYATKSMENYWKINDMSRGALDTESDSYYYSVSDGLSGEFVYDHDKNIVPLTANSHKFIKHNFTASFVGSTYSMDIVKDDGTIYVFDQQELTMYDMSSYCASTWWLSKIISPDRTDSITFEYAKDLMGSESAYPDFYLSEQIINGIGSSGLQCSALQRHMSATYTNQIRLSKINFKGGYIQFDYIKDRIDLKAYRLSTISVFNVNSLIKKYELATSYFDSGYNTSYSTRNKYRLKLNALKAYDNLNLNGLVNSYSFSYYEDNILPPYIQEYAYNNACFAIDHWGYYNGQVTNQHMLPYLPVEVGISANRTPDINYAKSCSLHQITYPTGGYTTFEYESNKKFDGSVAGGLRIKTVTTKENINAVPIIKRYEYNNNLLGRDIQMDAEGCYKYNQNILHMEGADCASNFNHTTIYMDNPVMPFVNHNGSPALYDIVDEYIDGGINYNLKTTYIYEAQPDIVYSVNSPRHQDQYFVDRAWRRGQLGGIIYSKFKAGTYIPIKNISNYYSDYRVKTIIAGIKVLPVIVYEISCYASTPDHYAYEPFNERFNYFDVTMEVGIKKLTKQFTTEYDDNGNNVTKEENFKYESPYHLNTTTSDLTDSRGSKVITLYKYPHDYAGTGVYDGMINSNRISPVIEQSEYKENTTNFLQSIITNYGYFQNNKIIAPSAIDLKTGSNNYETRMLYGAYDTKGNPQYICKDGATKMVYLWSYNGQYPVAKIEGISYTDMVNSYYSQSNIDVLTQTPAPTDGQINVIRTALGGSGALVTTYTYKPLVGITSMTDPRGVTTNYTYDTFNRLFLARNDDKNIIGRYRYGYQNAPDNGQGGYSAPAATVTPGATSYTSGATGTATLSSISGGSGSYAYSWYLKNSTGTVLASNLNTSSVSFSYSCSQTGTLTVQCVITDNGTGISRTVSANITVTSVTYSCNFTMQPGYSNMTNSISCDNSATTFYLVFSSNTTMQPYTAYLVANICPNCRPTTSSKSQTFTSGGKTWTVVVDPNGDVRFILVNGSAFPAGSYLGTGTLTFSK